MKSALSFYLIICSVVFTETSFAKHREGVALNACQKFYAGDRYAPAPDILRAKVDEYKKLMSLREIGDKPEHLTEIASKVNSLSKTARRKLMKLIRENYPLVKQFKYASGAPIKKMKRHFDFILSLESNAHEFFSEQLAKRPYQWESVLQAYYNIQAKAAGISKPVDVANVLYIAYRMQDMIKSSIKYAQSSIVLYGSTINGRSLNGISDLDYSVSDTFLLSKLESEALKFPELDNMSLSYSEGHQMRPKQTHSYGFLNPLVVVVYADYIEFRIYKRLPYEAYSRSPEFFAFNVN